MSTEKTSARQDAPPYISVADYKKMSYRQQLKAKLDYQAALETSIIHPNKGGSHTSALPKPATSCPTAAPMGIFGLLLRCKSAAVQAAAAEEQGYATEAAETDEDDDVKSHHDDIDTVEDNFNDCGFVPASTDEGIPIMPTVCSQWGHSERNPPFMAPFNVAVARTVGRKEVQSTPEATAACQKEWKRLRDKSLARR